MLALTAAALSFTTAVAQAGQTDGEPTTVRGTVINSVTHEPLARALVYSSDNRFAVLTNGSGEFEFVLPKANADTLPNGGGGIYSSVGGARSFYLSGNRLSLAARKPGFLDPPSGREEVTAPDGGEVTLSLVPEALIKGRVTLSTGDAAMGVAVQLYSRQVIDGLPRWVQTHITSTNSTGEFRFAELQAGAYKLVTNEFMDNDPVAMVPGIPLYGYPPMYYPGAADLAAAATIDLTAGQAFDVNLALVRQPYYAVKIPIANAPADGGIGVSVEGQRGPGYSLGYNSSEQRIEGSLPNGNYMVEAATYGTNAATGRVNLRVTGGPVAGAALALVPDSSVTFQVNTEFSKSDEGAVFRRPTRRVGAGQYLRARLEPVDNFGPLRGGAMRPPIGPQDDSLEIQNVSPGRYWLRLGSARGYVASATSGGTDLLHEPLVIGSGSNTTIEVTLRDDGAEVDGTVANHGIQTAGADDASPSAWVYFVPLPGGSGEFQAIGVSGNGKFAVPNVPPGSYRVLGFANMQPNLPYRDAEAMKVYDGKGQVIQLSARQKATIQVQISSE